VIMAEIATLAEAVTAEKPIRAFDGQ